MAGWRVACTAAAALTVVGLTSGCHSNGSGQAASTSAAATTTKAPLWDACSVPDSLIKAAGLRPETKEPDNGFSNSTACGWIANGFGLSIVSDNTMTLDNVRNKYGNHDFVDVTVAGRPALQYSDDPGNTDCDLAFTVRTGGLVAILFGKDDPTIPGTPCSLATNAATALMSALPPG
jgi:hypothetical protein